jgi:glycosyltransferase involved in cell wall biosynthesis
MDTHSPALYSWKWAWTVPLQRALCKPALVSIVDQGRYKRLFESWGAKALILERPPLRIPSDSLERIANADQFGVTVVNTFARDEPLDIILGAADQLPEVRFTVLGDTSLARKSLLRSAPDNVEFAGYLLGNVYWSQLYSSRAVIALTTYPYSLLGGAQEAMALGKPLILSRQPALMDYFTKGAIFVDHSVTSIVCGVQELQDREHHLTQDMVELAVEKEKRWNTAFQELLALIGEDTSKASQSGA